MAHRAAGDGSSVSLPIVGSQPANRPARTRKSTSASTNASVWSGTFAHITIEVMNGVIDDTLDASEKSSVNERSVSGSFGLKKRRPCGSVRPSSSESVGLSRNGVSTPNHAPIPHGEVSASSRS